MPVSVADAVRSAFRLLGQRFGRIVTATLVPLLLGWVVLCVSLNAYLSQLETFLRAPNAQVGSLALGLVAAGFFAALFLHAVVTVAVTEVALGIARPHWRYFRAGHSEWRLYAAYLRVLLICAGAVAAAILAAWIDRRLFGGGPAAYAIWFAINAAAAFALAVIMIRLAFLLAPVTLAEHGAILRRAFILSRGRSARIFAAGFVLMVPGVALQLGGEAALRTTRLLPSVHIGASFGDLVEILRGILPELLAISSAAYFVSVVLLAGAAASFYRATTGADSSAR